jgi:NAD(P)-dependent dehydrogenase (short-subunit alcohol dehydrogenase family)
VGRHGDPLAGHSTWTCARGSNAFERPKHGTRTLVRGLANKRVVVTGASSGIGRAIAERLAQERATLVLVGRNEERLSEVATATGGQAVVADLASDAGVAMLLDALKATGEQCHGWVLAAGEHALRPMMVESSASLEQAWRGNVSVALVLLTGALKRRLIAKGGSIVVITSVAARVGGAGQVAYAAGKAALTGAVRSLAVELAPQRIRVNAVSPGMVETPMTARNLGRLTDAQVGVLRARHLLGFGQAGDVAGPVAFLVSEDSNWVTGTELTVDGGFSAG